MRKRKLLLGLLGVAAQSSLLLSTAHADRRTGLGGNILIEDPDDLFPFPQYTLQHRNMIRLDYGGSSTSGNGVLTLGDDEQAVGISLHRGDLLAPDVVGFNQELAWLGGVGDPFGATDPDFSSFPGPDDSGDPDDPVLPATVVDLSYGRAIDVDSTFGLRFGFGRGVRAYDQDGEGVTKGAQTFFTFQGGYSRAPRTGLRYDTAANLVLAFGKSKVADQDVNSGYDLRLAALGRAYYPLNQFVDIGFLANVSVNNEHAKQEAPGGSASVNDFLFGLMGGIGPVVRLDRAKIAAYGGLRMDLGRNEPNSEVQDDELGRIRFAAPMFNMAAEVQVLDWLFVRTGAQYTWEVERFATETQKLREGTGSSGIVDGTPGSEGGFAWSFGLGLAKGSFYFDGVVQNAFVTDGPNFIGGNARGFLAMASLTYKFGDVFGQADRSVDSSRAEPVIRPAAPPPERAPEPVSPVAPAAPEAPDQEVAPPPLDASGSGQTTRGTGSVGGSAGGNLTIGR